MSAIPSAIKSQVTCEKCPDGEIVEGVHKEDIPTLECSECGDIKYRNL